MASKYRDPLDEVWIGAARRIGFEIARSGEVYASTDGRGVIYVGTEDTLDPDDCLAQMIFHELCHALVEGEDSWRRADWGLDNQSERDRPRELACLRLQAALAAPFGLRRVLAATTEHRDYYAGLPPAPLDGDGDEVVLARLGWQRTRRPPFAPHLADALAATAHIARAAAGFAKEDALLASVGAAAGTHQVGFPRRSTTETCGACAWNRGGRCRQAGKRVDDAWGACERWEAPLDCLTCGACCRAAYHSVEVSRRDPMVRRHPSLIVARVGYLEVRRDGQRCAALDVVGSRYSCAIYDDRPRTCREFELGGANCLEARRRVGLSW